MIMMMNTGEWHPITETKDYHIEPALMQRFIQLSRDNCLETLEQALTAEEQKQHAILMTLPQERWLQYAATLDSDSVVQLIRFFTKVEDLPGWEAGADSPVIWLHKALKQRGEKLSREQLLWIKANSRNHFLPNGPLAL